jgi:hypothetical protein
MEVFEVIANFGDEKKVEDMVSSIYDHYYSFVNFLNSGETVFVVKGEPGFIVRHIVSGSFVISRGLKITKLMSDALYVAPTIFKPKLS